MRRIFSAVLCFALIFSFSACSGKQTFLLGDFQKDVSFEVGDITVRGTLCRKGQEDMTFSVKEPENISDVVFTDRKVSSSGIEAEYGKNADNSPIKLLFSVVSDMAEAEITLPLKGTYSYCASLSSADYKVIFDCEKPTITSIETEKYTYKFE